MERESVDCLIGPLAEAPWTPDAEYLTGHDLARPGLCVFPLQADTLVFLANCAAKASNASWVGDVREGSFDVAQALSACLREISLPHRRIGNVTSNEATVEERQAWRHQKHERGRRQHPGGVTRVHLERLRRRGRGHRSGLRRDPSGKGHRDPYRTEQDETDTQLPPQSIPSCANVPGVRPPRPNGMVLSSPLNEV